MAETQDHLSQRQDEIIALQSIHSNELTLIPGEPSSGKVSIPVKLDRPVGIVCSTLHAQIRFLPPVEFHFRTGHKYPEEEAPEVHLQCSWLPEDKLQDLTRLIQTFWNDTKELCL